MAHPRMTHQALLDHLDGADTDLLRRVLEHAMQRLIEAEAAGQIGAEPHERTTARTTYRNGYRPRTLDTGGGRLELQIPKLRSGSFFPSLLEPRRRIDRALLAVVQEAYVLGISTRKVDDLMAALGGCSVSRSEVSRICALLDEELAESGPGHQFRPGVTSAPEQLLHHVVNLLYDKDLTEETVLSSL